MQRIQAELAVSVSDLKKSPAAVVGQARGLPVAVLNHNKVMAYLVPPEVYEAMLERLDDLDLARVAGERAAEEPVAVELDDL